MADLLCFLPTSNNELTMKGGISARETLCIALDAVLEAVRNEQHQIQTALARWQNWQSIAVRLPAEILSTIFELACIPQLNSPIPKSQHRQSLRKTRAAIRQTCSRWAETAWVPRAYGVPSNPPTRHTILVATTPTGLPF